VDINYLFLRQQIERSRAKVAASNEARKIHEQLAVEYERQIEEATDGRIMFEWGKAPHMPRDNHRSRL
jgi:hypothetical protein